MALNEMSTPPALLDHGVEVLLHGLLVERVDLRGLGDAAGSNDLLGDGIHLRHVASRQEDPCPLACESPGDGAADRAPGSIDHGGLVSRAACPFRHRRRRERNGRSIPGRSGVLTRDDRDRTTVEALVRGDTLDEAVLARARAGDEQAFRELTEPHRRELQLHCYRILGSVQDAEDMVQETLLAAWRSLEAFEGRASVRSWLYRIATNRCLNALRARSRRPREVPAMDDSLRAHTPHRARLARAIPRRAARGHPGPLRRAGGALRGQGVDRALVHRRPPAPAAAPARGAGARRRARLPHRRGRRDARHRRGLGQGRPAARPRDAPGAAAGRRPRARAAAELRERAPAGRAIRRRRPER